MIRALARKFARGAAELMVSLAATVVPSEYRERFREEWRAELWHACPPSSECADLDVREHLDRAWGVFADALATRRLRVREIKRHSRYGGTAMGSLHLLQAVRLSFRSFLARPWPTAVAVATLALGIGATTAIFSLVQAVLVRPLDYPESDRLAKITGVDVTTGVKRNLSPNDFYDIQSESEAFESMGAHGWVGFFTVSGDGEPERVAGSNVTAGFLRTLGVEAALGRIFLPEDDTPGSAPTVVLTHAFWQRRFGGAPNVLGERIDVNAVPHEIIGVLPAHFRHPEPNPEREPALYTLYRFDRSEDNRDGHFIRGVGRLSEGRSLQSASAELDAIAARLEARFPESNTDRWVRAVSLKESIVKESRGGLLLLQGAVAALLLIACANIANLQLAHGGERRHELGIKTALGARRRDLVVQMLIESWLLAMMGGALGLGVAVFAQRVLALRFIPRATDIAVDPAVAGFAFVVATLCALLFGLAPALKLSSSNVRNWIEEAGARSTFSWRRGGNVLITAEVALSLVLLVAAGLLGKSLYNLRAETPGFRSDQVLTMSLSLPLARYEEGEQIPFYERLYERIESLPEVQTVGAANILPLSQNYSSDGFQIEQRPAPKGQNPSAEARSVSPGYFEAMSIPLLRGRLFTSADDVHAPRVIVISESMAETFWPGEDPIGRRITYNRGVLDEDRQEIGGPGSREIVGIVGDVKHLDLGAPSPPTFYTPQAHPPSFHSMTLAVRTDGDAEHVAASVRRELAELDGTIPLYGVRTLQAVVDGAVVAPRFRSAMLSVFAALALLLSLVGVYAVVGVLVGQRTREIGLRMALGAGKREVARLLVSQSMKPVLWGVAVGLIGCLGVSRLLTNLLYGVAATDLTTYFAVAAVLVAAALMAALIPTLRAAGIDPVDALRME